ncbi:MAG: sigma-54-dependent Fis family transcriptional regulator [Spirochaetales bacterium]|nr:sigma-54-dependent Fis family transcriptional regulator [Spirochaetales bacterium]
MEDKVVIIEDEVKLLDLLLFNLRETYRVEGYSSAEDFFDNFTPEDTLVVITDVRLPGMSGVDLLKYIRENYPGIPVVVMTAFGSIHQAVASIKVGAYDYLTKPVTAKTLSEVIHRVSQFRRSLAPEVPSFPPDFGFLSADHLTLEQCGLAARVADKKIPVLILGETGTGKELISEYLHSASGRKGTFVKINCAAIPSELLEGELFGYSKGAFTGAHQNYAGKMKLADGGTLFLDEIGDLPESLQAKLLRVLEDESFYPVGDNTLRKVDLRVVAATNKDLKEEVEQGCFRSDLYYRLAVVPIRIPPLRDRPCDIALIAEKLFLEMKNQGKTHAKKIDGEVLEVFAGYSWPGNVRELKNVLTHMALLADGEVITTKDIPREILQVYRHDLTLPETYDELKELKKLVKQEAVTQLEKDFLFSALNRHDWNVSRTAEKVGMDRRYLQNLIKKYGLRKKALNRKG